MFVGVIAATVTSAQSVDQMDERATTAVANSLRSAADACLGVHRVATGWSVTRVCATATGSTQADASVDDNSNAGGTSSTTEQTCWLDVPVVAAGLLIWARTHLEVVLRRYVWMQIMNCIRIG